MADPVTIIGTAGAAANVLSTLTSTIETFHKLCLEWRNADFTFLNLIAQLTALRAAVNKIQDWILAETEAHPQLNMDLDLSLYCCYTLIDKMNSKISGLCADDRRMSLASKLKLLFDGKSMDSMQKMIERQTNALTLLLAAYSWYALFFAYLQSRLLNGQQPFYSPAESHTRQIKHTKDLQTSPRRCFISLLPPRHSLLPNLLLRQLIEVVCGIRIRQNASRLRCIPTRLSRLAQREPPPKAIRGSELEEELRDREIAQLFPSAKSSGNQDLACG